MKSAIAAHMSRVALIAAIGMAIVFGAPMAEASAAPLTGLHPTLTLDKDLYHVGDTANVTITLTNSGPVALTGITAGCNRIGNANQLNASGPGWAALASTGAGVTIPAGQTLTFHISATVPQAAQQFGYYAAICDFGNVDGPGRPQASDKAYVPGGHGAVTVHANKLASGGSPGLAVSGVGLAIVHTAFCPYLARGTTNSAGTFTFSNIPPGTYDLYIYPPKGSKVAPPQNPTPFDVIGGSTGNLSISLTAGSAAVPATPATPTINCDTWVPPSDSLSSTGPASPTGPILAATGYHPATPLMIGLALIASGIALTSLGARRREV